MVSVAAGAMVNESVALAVADALSRTWTVNVNVPAALGVPEMAPVPLVSDSPPGRDPDVSDQVFQPSRRAAAKWSLRSGRPIRLGPSARGCWRNP